MARNCATDLTLSAYMTLQGKQGLTRQFLAASWTNKSIYCSKHYYMVVQEGLVNLISEWTKLSIISPACSQGSTSQQTDVLMKKQLMRAYSIQQEIELKKLHSKQPSA